VAGGSLSERTLWRMGTGVRVRVGELGETARKAWTEGLSALGQAEIVVPLQWSEDSERDRLIMRLLEFIGAYVARQPRRILAGQTLTYGWTTLRFDAADVQPRAGAIERLVMHELCDPFGVDAAQYCAGAARAIGLVRVQGDALRRNGITGEAEHPHRMHLAIACTRAMRRNGSLAEPLVLERDEPTEAHDSGWVVRCADPAHNHDDPNELHRVHLLHVVSAFPVVFGYLAMPAGTAVTVSEQEAIVFPPREDEGVVDPMPSRALP
jgi:hypothetical protein